MDSSPIRSPHDQARRDRREERRKLLPSQRLLNLEDQEPEPIERGVNFGTDFIMWIIIAIVLVVIVGVAIYFLKYPR